MVTTRCGDIFGALKAKGLNVFFPGQHVGDCIAPYVVVKNNGTTGYGSFSSNYTLYDIMCYVHKDSCSTLETYVDAVKNIMDTLKPMIIPVHSETPAFYDESNKSHMISVQYKNNRKQ